MPSRILATAFDPRANGLTWIRLGLALTVAVVHGLRLSTGWQPRFGPGTDLGDLAVDGFFVLSGYLVAGSLLRLGSVRRYVWHRFLRIMPGFWTCLIVTALVVAPLVAVLGGRGIAAPFSAAESAQGYLAHNALLLIRQFDIGGLGPVAADGNVDGALWTLAYEAACYLAVVVLGALGLLTRRKSLLVALVVALQVLTVLQAAGIALVPQERMLRLLMLFLLGALGLLLADRVRLSVPIAVAAAASVVLGVALLPDYRAVGAVGFAYLVLGLMAVLPARRSPRTDLSYGLYIYHWPVTLVVLAAGADALGAAAVLIALPVSLGVAALSWRLVEAPALRLKSAAWVTAPLRQRSLRPRRLG